MTMPMKNRIAYRANARALGEIFLFLSALSLIGTIWGFFKTLSLGTQIGVNASQDPVAWFILIAGVFISLTLAGFGTVLGTLSAIFDQQIEPLLAPVPQ